MENKETVINEQRGERVIKAGNEEDTLTNKQREEEEGGDVLKNTEEKSAKERGYSLGILESLLGGAKNRMSNMVRAMHVRQEGDQEVELESSKAEQRVKRQEYYTELVNESNLEKEKAKQKEEEIKREREQEKSSTRNKRETRFKRQVGEKEKEDSVGRSSQANVQVVVKEYTVGAEQFIKTKNSGVSERVLVGLFKAQELMDSEYVRGESEIVEGSEERGGGMVKSSTATSENDIEERKDEERKRREDMDRVAGKLRDDEYERKKKKEEKMAGQASTGAIWAMEFSLDGRYLAAGGRDGLVRVWRVSKRRRGAAVFGQRPYRVYAGHGYGVFALSWSINGFLLSGSMDNTARLWHPKRSECLGTYTHEDAVTCLEFHPLDDRQFVTGSLDGSLQLWDVVSGTVRARAQMADKQMITAVGFTGHNGEEVMAGTYKGLCVSYSVPQLEVKSRLYARSSRGLRSGGSKVTGILFIARTKALSADNKFRAMFGEGDEGMVLVSCNDSRLRVYTHKTHTLVCKLKGHRSTGSQASGSFSADGRHIICGSEEHKIFVWPLLQNLSGKHMPPTHLDPDKTVPHDMRHTGTSRYESFRAHMDRVGVARFAPLTTLRLLHRLGDPILARYASVDDIDPTAIIVSADFSGRIYVFRRDIQTQQQQQQQRQQTQKTISTLASRRKSLIKSVFKVAFK